LGVGDGDLAVLEQVGVVGFVQVAGGRAGLVPVSDLPEDLSGGVGDDLDRLVLLLVGDDGVSVIDEEGVVGKEESVAVMRRGARGELPDSAVGGVEQEEPVVPSVRD